jgi:hypothetical protein
VPVRSTPLYDALVDEYRMALRSLPGDRSGEDLFLPRYPSIPAPYNPNPRHRRTPGDSMTQMMPQMSMSQFRY